MPIEQDEDRIHQEIITKNLLLLFILVATPFIIIFYLLGRPDLSISVLPFSGLMLLGLILNMKGYPVLARCLALLAGNLALAYYTKILGHDYGVEYIFIPFCIAPIILFKSIPKLAHFLTGLTIVLFYFSEFLIWQKAGIGGLNFKTITFLTMSSVAFIMAIYILYIFSKVTSDYEDQLTKRNQSLEQALADLKKSRKDAETMAEQSAYAMLTRGIAHEIKNPLAMLQSRSEIILATLKNPVSDEALKNGITRFAEIIIRNMDRLNKLINSMLAYGINPTKNQEAFSLTDLLEDIIELAKPKCNKKQIKLEFLQPSENPKNIVFGNKVYLYQAILNIVANAIQYTPPHGSITLSTEPTEFFNTYEEKQTGIKLIIKDTGEGIPEENLTQIFDPYFTTKHDQENTGLGLSFAYRVITENAGLLRIESELKKGTTANIYLPNFARKSESKNEI